MPDTKYLDSLNTAQREAVCHSGSPLLILAGAGSGKTRVITTKIAYMIRELGAEPESILAVTFTNKAAREMAERAAALDSRAARACMRTFHSFGAWFLRRNATKAGLDTRFVIYDDDDMVSLLASIAPHEGRPVLSRYAHAISRAKDYMLGPEDPSLDTIDYRPEFRSIYAEYEKKLLRTGNVDFGDLIKKPLEILRDNDELRLRTQRSFKTILVDEYQDSNVAQFELLRQLYGPETYLCVVGDDDQSIYRFRGAEVRNILEFPDLFPGTTIVRLEENYRSCASILRVASSVVSNNTGRLGKTLRAVRGEGKTPVLAFLQDQDAEASFCAELIVSSRKQAVAAGETSQWADWAILYRTNAQSLSFETEFLRRKIPYKVIGSLKFYDREEIKDALALLSLCVNPRDEVAFKRMVNKPARGIGEVSVGKILAAAARDAGYEQSGESPSLALASDPGNLLHASRSMLPVMSNKARLGLGAFLKVFEEAQPLLAGTVQNKPDKGKELLRAGDGLSVFVAFLALHSGLADYHKGQDELAGTQRLANLQELVNAASLYSADFEGLAEFLEHIELDRSMASTEEGEDAVNLITVHNTKGLEFPKVVMSGMEHGVFPRDDKQDEDLEEERRLFYVGATRAMDELYLSCCSFRRLFGRSQLSKPSLFLGEIDPSSIRILGRMPPEFPHIRELAGFSGKRSAGSTDIVHGQAASDQAVAGCSWKRGDRLFHDDYGYGYVCAVKDGAQGPVVHTKFETGKELAFLSEHQNSRFMKVDDDV